MRFGRFFYWIDVCTFLLGLFLFGNFKKGECIYVRNPFFFLLFTPRKFKLYAEIHDIPERKWLFMRMLRKADGIIAITNALKGSLVDLGIASDIIAVIPDAVDITKFDIKISKEEARERLSLPRSGHIVLYTGHLYKWKGAEALAESTAYLPDVKMIFLGGVVPEIDEFRKKYGHNPKIAILPFTKQSVIPLFLKAADVLVIPNSGKYEISRSFTSPLKLFEYMASGRPIVASDLPSIREILNEDNANFSLPDDPPSLANGIEGILADKNRSDALAKRAREDVEMYSWQKRAQAIKSFLENDKA
jgi:glycosyltransferase involved in cell wall biosynthesis